MLHSHWHCLFCRLVRESNNFKQLNKKISLYCSYRFSSHEIILFSQFQPQVYFKNILKTSQISASIFIKNILIKKRKSAVIGRRLLPSVTLNQMEYRAITCQS